MRAKLKCSNGWSRRSQIRGSGWVSRPILGRRRARAVAQSAPSCSFNCVLDLPSDLWPANQMPRINVARKHTRSHGQAWLVTPIPHAQSNISAGGLLYRIGRGGSRLQDGCRPAIETFRHALVARVPPNCSRSVALYSAAGLRVLGSTRATRPPSVAFAA